MLLIDEGGLLFEVNFASSWTVESSWAIAIRAEIRELMKVPALLGFLNLFAYTGTATCYAADGGALHSTTVDLSQAFARVGQAQYDA